jgi:hypothetical protein
MTPSSAATTKTTMSVTLAPRSRIELKAACPGVSKNVTWFPLDNLTENQDNKYI